MTTISTNPDDLLSLAGHFLPNIFSTAITIAQKVEQVKINKRQCQTLLKRIEIVISYLQKPELLKRIQVKNDPLNQTLENFQQFLEECYHFISSFVDRSRIFKFISSSSYKDEFNLLNDQLQIYYSELTLGINIKNLIDNKQNEYDRNEDLHELLTIIIEQQKILIDQQYSLFENQTKRFDQLEQILSQNNVQPQLKVQSALLDDIFQNIIWSNRCFEYGK